MFKTIVALLMVVAMLAGCRTESPTEADFEATVADWAGEHGENCGKIGVEEDRSTAIACAEQAIQQNEPFYVIFALQGVDSSVFQALARNDSGEFQMYFYDSNIYGSGGIEPKGSLDQISCLAPTLSATDRPIDCK